MKTLSHVSVAALVAAFASSGAAWADVTADQVWQDWKSYYTDLGATVTTGSEATEGDALVVRDLKIVTDLPDGSSEVMVPELRFRDLGDGTVEVTLSPEVPMTFHGKTADGPDADVAMKMAQRDMVSIVSGAPEDMTYAVTAPELSIEVDQLKVEGEKPPFKMKLTARDGKGTYRSVKDAGRTVTSDFSAAAMDVVLTGADPESGNTFNLDGTMNGLTGVGSFAMPEGIDMKNLGAALKAGALIDGNFAYSDGSYHVTGTESDGDFTVTSSGGAGKLTFHMAADGIAYGGETQGSKFELTSASIPFPVAAELGQSAFNLAMPVSKSDEAQPGAFLLKLVDLKLSDDIWNIFDPTSQLPRDPATLVLDLSGSLKPLFDIFDPEAAKALESEVTDPMAAPTPFEVTEAKINQLQLKAAGAELTGTGAATFDNSQTPPKPVGEINLNLTGANALMDKLTAIGLLPADTAMGARMMMGMFAVPAGDDALTSKIEFKEDGGIYANGQRIQ
jgi:hypothetical protein